tara:strand:+ start:898 stop:2295 length:1398 start_codon:yes stop_codon:yes gene_type:complete
MLEFLYILGGCIVGYVVTSQFLKNKKDSNEKEEVVDFEKQLEIKDHDHDLEIKNLNEKNDIHINNLENFHKETLANLKTNHTNNVAQIKAHHEQQINQINNHHQKEINQLNVTIEENKGNKDFFVKEIGKNLKLDVATIVKEANLDTAKFTKQKIAPDIKSIEQAKNKMQEGLTYMNNLSIQTNSLQKEITTLSKVFDSNPHARGEYGQENLRNILERNGMRINVDFVEQKNFKRDEKDFFPDYTIYLPKNESLVADAKAPIKDFKFAMETNDKKEQKEFLKKHAKAVRTYVNQLSSKAYWDDIKSFSPQMVIMYLPADHFLSEAMKIDPEIQQDAMRKKILICTPSSIFAVIKAVQATWNSHTTNENTKKIIEIFKDALGSIATLGVHMGKLQRSISTVGIDFNKVVSSYNSNLIPKAKKIKNYGVDSGKQPIEIIDETKLINKDLKILTKRDLDDPKIMKQVV